MFDKLVVSCPDKQKRRVTRYLISASLGYLLCLAVAIVLSILTSNPQLAEAGDSGIRIAAPFVPLARDDSHPVQSSQRSGAPTRSPSDSADLTHAFNPDLAPREGGSVHFAPPDANCVDCLTSGAGGHDDGVPGGTIDGTGLPGVISPAPPPQPEPDPPAKKKVDTKQLVRLSQPVLQGKAIVRVEPPYPPLAKAVRLSGSVVVEIIISPQGAVESARAISGHPMFVSAAVEAARGWRFQPTLLGDVPVRVTGLITFVFSMN